MAQSNTCLLPDGQLSRPGGAACDDVAPFDWRAHSPFLLQLATALRPRQIVDLDAQDSSSEDEFCEDESCATPALADAAALVGARLLSGPQALAALSGQTIDCLNLGLTGDAAEADRRWAAWRPRLAPDAVILAPGLARRGDVARAEFFARIGAAGRVFAFAHHGGLGVIALGATPDGLAPFFSPSPDAPRRVEQIYDRLARSLAGETALAGRIIALEALARRLDLAIGHLKQGDSSVALRRGDELQTRLDALAARVEQLANAPPPHRAPTPVTPGLLDAFDLRLVKAERRIKRLSWHAAILMPLTGPLVLVLRYISRKAKKTYRKLRPRR